MVMLAHAGEGKQVYVVTDSNANLFLPETHQKCSPATWAANGLVKVTHKMNHHRLLTEV